MSKEAKAGRLINDNLRRSGWRAVGKQLRVELA